MYSYIHKSYRINRWTLKISQAEHRSSVLLAHDRKLFIYRCIFIFIFKYFPSLVFSSIHSVLLFQGIYHLWLLSPITHINNTHPDTKIIHNYCVLFLVFFFFHFRIISLSSTMDRPLIYTFIYLLHWNNFCFFWLSKLFATKYNSRNLGANSKKKKILLVYGSFRFEIQWA